MAVSLNTELIGIYCEVKLTLAERIPTTEASTLEVKFCNFELPAQFSSMSATTPVYPLLLEIPDILEEHDDLMPRLSTSRILIDNSENSLGMQRKLSDLFDYYTIVEQPVTVKFIEIKESGNTSYSADRSWSFLGDSIDANLDRGTITINIKNNILKDKVITKEISAAAFPSAPTENLGKFLPIALGADVGVIATRVSTTEHALTTTIGTTHPLGSITEYQAKHPDGTFTKVLDAGNTATYVIDNSGTGTLTTALQINTGIMSPIKSASPYIIDRFTVTLKGTSSASPTGTLTLQILESKNGEGFGALDNDYHVLGTATLDKSTGALATGIAGSAEFEVTFEFKDPVILANDRGSAPSTYLTTFFTLTDSNNAKPVNANVYFFTGTPTQTLRRKNNNVWTVEYADTLIRHRIRGMTLTPSLSSAADSNGLGYSKITVGKGYASCDESSLELAARVNGLSTGGSTKAYIYEILPMFFTSSEFDSSDIFSTFSALTVGGTYERVISGATVGKTGRIQLARELLRNTACKLVSLASSGSAKVGLYCWGNELTRVVRVDDTILKSFKYSIGNRQTVVNNVTASYNRDVLKTVNRSVIEQGGQSGYLKVLANQTLSDSTSQTLYGSNDLANSSFPFIAADTSMSSVCQYYLRSFEQPFISVEFAIPFFAVSEVDGLLSTQVIDIVTAKLPAFYGTASKPLATVYSGEDVIHTTGYDTIRAKQYRTQIISKSLKQIDGILCLYFQGEILNTVFNPT